MPPSFFYPSLLNISLHSPPNEASANYSSFFNQCASAHHSWPDLVRMLSLPLLEKYSQECQHPFPPPATDPLAKAAIQALRAAHAEGRDIGTFLSDLKHEMHTRTWTYKPLWCQLIPLLTQTSFAADPLVQDLHVTFLNRLTSQGYPDQAPHAIRALALYPAVWFEYFLAWHKADPSLNNYICYFFLNFPDILGQSHFDAVTDWSTLILSCPSDLSSIQVDLLNKAPCLSRQALAHMAAKGSPQLRPAIFAHLPQFLSQHARGYSTCSDP